MPGDKLVSVCPEGFGSWSEMSKFCESSSDRGCCSRFYISPLTRDGFDEKLRRLELAGRREMKILCPIM